MQKVINFSIEYKYIPYAAYNYSFRNYMLFWQLNKIIKICNWKCLTKFNSSKQGRWNLMFPGPFSTSLKAIFHLRWFFHTFNKSAADDFESIKVRIKKL